GRSDLFLRVEIIKKVIITIAIFVGIRYGIWGLLIGSVISSYAALIVNMYYTDKLIDYPYSAQFRDLMPILVHSIPMSVVVYLFINHVDLSSAISLGGGILMGAITYLGTTRMFRSEALNDILSLLGGRFPRIKKASK